MGLLNRKRTNINGRITFKGRDLLTASPDEMRAIRGKEIAMIFQDPFACLHPMYKIGDQLAEAVLVAREGLEESCARQVGRAPLRPSGFRIRGSA